MLSARDPPQKKRYTKTKSKGIQKRYFMQRKMKKKVR